MTRSALAVQMAGLITAMSAIGIAGCGSSQTTSTTVTVRTSPGSTRHRAPLTVTPRTGRPGTRFRFAFRVPRRPARHGKMTVIDTLSVAGGHGSGCVSAHSFSLPAADAGRPLTMAIGPAQLDGRWCIGVYSARVEELARPRCGPAQVCPQFIRVVASIGPVRFRIRR